MFSQAWVFEHTVSSHWNSFSIPTHTVKSSWVTPSPLWISGPVVIFSFELSLACTGCLPALVPQYPNDSLSLNLQHYVLYFISRQWAALGRRLGVFFNLHIPRTQQWYLWINKFFQKKYSNFWNLWSFGSVLRVLASYVCHSVLENGCFPCIRFPFSSLYQPWILVDSLGTGKADTNLWLYG